MKKLKVVILGATGMVGQRFVQLLAEHPWFEIASLTASDRSAGKPYAEACTWRQDTDMPESVKSMIVQPSEPNVEGSVAFSGLDAGVAGEVELAFAAAGYGVVSNAKNHRMAADVPLLVPEINPDHIDIIPIQQKNRGWNTGFIVTNPNCVAVPMAMALGPLHKRWGVEKVFVVTMQALSGAGYPGHAALDIIDNVIPFIGGEEPKVEVESNKILGTMANNSFVHADFRTSAMVNRVAVIDGHMLSLSIAFKQKPSVDEVKQTLREFTSEPQQLQLPSAPIPPIVVRDEDNRPQPRLDRNTGNSMGVSIGRVRECPLFDIKMTVLGHNTIRGAAGAAILNAELLKAKGYLD
ncbi:aspartate-semialdehyde dehydrogenase [candidate division KSB1 bacterium]|nr:aspartate-semialdehyde dehydrogenase [candidate division KSB1 bacterium]